MWHTHREPWFGVEYCGYEKASAGGQLVGRQICRVNRQKTG
jgi:hypothetical protein